MLSHKLSMMTHRLFNIWLKLNNEEADMGNNVQCSYHCYHYQSLLSYDKLCMLHWCTIPVSQSSIVMSIKHSIISNFHTISPRNLFKPNWMRNSPPNKEIVLWLLSLELIGFKKYDQIHLLGRLTGCVMYLVEHNDNQQIFYSWNFIHHGCH